ncbi:MAG: Ig-like domain-containing protein [Terriglobales bacterium]
MTTRRRFAGKRLPLTLAFGVLVAAAIGAACNGFFVDPTLTSLTINPTTPSVELQTSVTLQAFGVYSDGTSSYLTSGVSWSSSDPTIATVTGAGSAKLTGLQIGTATISAGSQSVTSTATATVFINVSSLSINPTSQSLAALNATTPLPYVVTAVTANGTIDISSSAVLTAYLNGTVSTDVQCTYDTANPTGGSGGAGLYCFGDDSEAGGTYQLIATYTGTTLTATAKLIVP